MAKEDVGVQDDTGHSSPVPKGGKVGKKSAVPYLDHLTVRLFAPGMSPLHRAGVGGLACTLHAMQQQYETGQLIESKLPGPYVNGVPPWEIQQDQVKLRFESPENASEYLRKLFEFGFQISNEGLIFLPGQSSSTIHLPVLADLQAGLTLTFLQHGKARDLLKEPASAMYSPEDGGEAGVVVQYRRCLSYKHQHGWEDVAKAIRTGPLKVEGPICPGNVVRHVAFTSVTAAAESAERMLALYFALVGCLALPINRGVGALIVPEVNDLKEFIYDRPAMTPMTAQACQVANAADAGLQAQLRLRSSPLRLSTVASQAKKTIEGLAIPACYTMTFAPTPWASQQKSRVATLTVPRGDDKILARFDRALALLPPRIKVITRKEASGRGKEKKVVERREAVRMDSVVRPMIAENLARSRPWYSGFASLMFKNNPATDKPYLKQLQYEQKGLHAMISDPSMWDEEGEMLVVKAVHEAIRQSLGRIREETDGKSSKGLSQATKNRWERFRERLRLDLVGSKTPAQLRFALTDLFSRGGNNSVLRDGWTKVLPVIRCNWQLARDLGLLALASYVGRERDEEESDSAT